MEKGTVSYGRDMPVKQGRLKIFFGYAAGVGKTYAMLEAAHQAKKEGIDIVVGYGAGRVADKAPF